MGQTANGACMKILFCVEFYYPSVGGAQEVVRQIAERMVARGHEVTVATSQIAARTGQRHNGVRIVGFPVSGNRVRGLGGEVDAFQRFLVEHNADVVFFYAAQQWTFDAAWPVLDRLKAKKVLVPCGYSGLFDPAYADYFSELGNTLAKMNAVVYHAHQYRDLAFAESLGLSNGIVIPNGADLDEFEVPLDPNFRARLDASDSTFVMLTVGTVTGTKGHLELLQAYAIADFGGRDTVLILNGNRPEHGAAKLSAVARFSTLVRGYGWKYALRHAIKSGILAMGISAGRPSIERVVNDIHRSQGSGKRVLQLDLPREQLIQAYLQSDLFVFASNIEYSPLVLFESAAAALPFLTVPVGNAEEIIEWTGGGELCPAPVDERRLTRVEPEELAQRIVSLADDPARRELLGHNGQQAARARFNWNSLASEYEALFIQLSTGNQAVTHDASRKAAGATWSQ